MAVVRVPRGVDDVSNMQLGVPLIGVPLSAVQPLLLAARLRRNLADDSLVLLRSDLLRLRVPARCEAALPLRHLGRGPFRGRGASLTGSVEAAVPGPQGGPVPRDGALRGGPRGTCGGGALGKPPHRRRAVVRAGDGGSIRRGGGLLCPAGPGAVAAREVRYRWT